MTARQTPARIGPLPSGTWLGIYNFHDGGPSHPITMELTFLEGRIRGTGSDEHGFFTLSGTYDLESGECHMLQARGGVGQAEFRGFAELDSIWGTWRIASTAHGGFRIWPRPRAPLPLVSSRRTHSQ
jgi:hypothetical protein